MEGQALSSHPPKSATVLIVEDDDDLRYTLSELLEAEGYTTATAASVAEALAVMGQLTVAVVVTDMKFARGDADGWALARAVAPRLPRPPVIAFTGSEGILALQGSGLFFDAVEKGDPTLLLDVVAEALAAHPPPP